MSTEDMNDGQDQAGAESAASDTEADFDAAFNDAAEDKAGPPSDDGRHDDVDVRDDKDAQGDHEDGADTGADAKATGTDNADAGSAGSKTPPQDIWANASTEQKTELEALQEKLRTAEATAKRHQNQVPGLNRKVYELEQELRRRTDEGGREAEENARPAGELFETEDWKDLDADYPGIAGSLKSFVESQNATIERLQQQVGTLSEGEQKKIYSENFATLEQEHPDIRQIAGTPEINAWAKDQPKFVQDGLKRNQSAIVDPYEAARIVSMFKADKGIGQKREGEPASPAQGGKSNLTPRQKRQLAAASSPETKGPGKVAGAPDGFDDAWDFEAKKRGVS